MSLFENNDERRHHRERSEKWSKEAAFLQWENDIREEEMDIEALLRREPHAGRRAGQTKDFTGARRDMTPYISPAAS